VTREADTSPLIEEFLNYKLTVQNRSKLTVEQYRVDLMLFFKYIICSRDGTVNDEEKFENTDISSVDVEFAKSVTSSEVYAFLTYTSFRRDNQAAARARKLSSIKGFYKYLSVVRKKFDHNPAKDIETPRVKKSLPKYLTLEEALTLLEVIDNDIESKTRKRDYAIVTLFLNCGMRLSELVGLNLVSLERDMKLVRVVGKGNKERIVYLNEACKNALTDYLDVRSTLEIKDKNALFISRLGKRISKKTVQWMIYKYLDMAGLGYRQLSTHKLRHTAATLMYQSGKVDIRVLKDILGHEQLNTTQIYTHVSSASMEKAMEFNPLSHEKGTIAPKSGAEKKKKKKSDAGSEDSDTDAENGNDNINDENNDHTDK